MDTEWILSLSFEDLNYSKDISSIAEKLCACQREWVEEGVGRRDQWVFMCARVSVCVFAFVCELDLNLVLDH